MVFSREEETMHKIILTVLLLAYCPLIVAQQALNNDAVIKLVKAGLSDDLIVSTINASPSAFDSSADGIIALKAAGVSDKVVAAVVAPRLPRSPRFQLPRFQFQRHRLLQFRLRRPQQLARHPSLRQSRVRAFQRA
jgi:hypothetical protein